ncbi:MAG: HAD family hydrolase [Pseudomonadota bacterium]
MIRIAMFSGPRHRSTALMRAWGNRTDTMVWDEPFYGFYLQQTGIDHPMREIVLAAVETDWKKVAARCSSFESTRKDIFFQKHMTHHMLPNVDLDWLEDVTCCFLTRDPTKVLQSYRKRRDAISEADLGYTRAAELFEFASRHAGKTPAVIDADDIARDPEGVLRLLCQHIGVEFEPAMLSWEAGPRPTDGVWGPHWYRDLWQSTGFGPRPADTANPPEDLPEDLATLAALCRPHYEQLRHHNLAGHA